MSKEFIISNKCEYIGCENDAEYIDEMDSYVCSECMDREIQDGTAEQNDFEII